MQETPQEYIQRMQTYIVDKDPIRVQKATAQKLATAIKGMDKKKLSKRPAPGKWSITEILAHLADTEMVASWRMRLILGHNGALVQAFDQDVWATTFKYQKTNPRRSLETFRLLRENNLALLKSLPKELMENYGMHQERGKETIVHITRMFAGHDLNHLQQVEQIVKASRRK
jgi:DinB family protein